MANLGTAAASLLVLSPLMQGQVAQAFLGVIAASQKYQASNKEVIAAYTKFFTGAAFQLLAHGVAECTDLPHLMC